MSHTKSGGERILLEAAAPVRAPLAGVLVGGALRLGFVAWTGVRIHAAQQAQTAVSNKRTADAQKAVQEAAAPQKVHNVRVESQSWQPVVEFEGSLQAAQSAALAFKVNGRLRIWARAPPWRRALSRPSDPARSICQKPCRSLAPS